jgi:hypothetical protein
MSSKITFYRGVRSGYKYSPEKNSGDHKDSIYFSSDTKEILMNGVCYGQALEWWEEGKNDKPSNSSNN